MFAGLRRGEEVPGLLLHRVVHAYGVTHLQSVCHAEGESATRGGAGGYYLTVHGRFVRNPQNRYSVIPIAGRDYVTLVIAGLVVKLGLLLMRCPLFALALVASSAFTGCSSDTISMPGPLREKFSPSYHTHVVQADQRKTYDAARAALKAMDFKVERGGPAQGKISGVNTVSSSQDLRSARQMSVDIKLTKQPDGTEVAALFSEIQEDDFNKHPGMGTSNPVRESGVYEVFFQHLDRALATPAK